MESKIFSFLNAISTFYAIYHVATAGRCHEEQKNSSLLVSAQIFVYMRAVDPHQSETRPRIHVATICGNSK